MRGIVEQIDCVHLIQTGWVSALAADGQVTRLSVARQRLRALLPGEVWLGGCLFSNPAHDRSGTVGWRQTEAN